MNTIWHPKWWKAEVHGTAWDRIREAARRDWEQTKKDLHLGGHELNQKVTDTVKQVAGTEPLPPADKANPPTVIGNFDDIELPLGYGFSAQAKYGAQYPRWDASLEDTLRSEWNEGRTVTQKEWNDVSRWVRHGYEYKANS